MKTISACILLAVLSCQTARADLITIVLGSSVQGLAIDDVVSGSIIRDGLTITLAANNGTLNATNETYGINAVASGDKTALLDDGSGTPEWITISFDQPIEFTQLSLGLYGNGEEGHLTLGDNPPLTPLSSGTGLNVFDFTAASFPLGNFLPTGKTATIRYVSGNGFSLEGIQVNTVPEPTTFALSAFAMAGLTLRRQKRRFPTE